jgi:hypothetical protein
MVSTVVSLCICLKFRTMQNALLRPRRQEANVQEVPVPQRLLRPWGPLLFGDRATQGAQNRRGPRPRHTPSQIMRNIEEPYPPRMQMVGDFIGVV